MINVRFPPIDSDGDLPLAIQHFLRDSLNLDLTSPDSHVMSLDYERFVIGSVFPFEVTLFIG